MTITQQTPIKDDGKAIEIGLGSSYASQLGLKGVNEFSSAVIDQNNSTKASIEEDNSKEKNVKKKKKNNKKKKKKK